MTVDEFKAKLFHVDEAKFTDWHERMTAEYHELAKKYKTLQEIRERMPKENFAIDDLPPIIRKKLETNADALFFSPDSLAKQFKKHPGMTAAEHIDVLNEIKNCKDDYIYSVEDYKLILLVRNGNWYKVTLKTTHDRTETYMVSMFRLHDRDLKRELAIIKALKRATAKQ